MLVSWSLVLRDPTPEQALDELNSRRPGCRGGAPAPTWALAATSHPMLIPASAARLSHFANSPPPLHAAAIGYPLVPLQRVGARDVVCTMRVSMSPSLPVSMSGVTSRHEDGYPIFAVEDPNALTQVIGWLKFTNSDSAVLYRGQTGKHPEMLPTGLRGLGGLEGRRNLSHALRRAVSSLAGSECSCIGGPFPFGQAHRCVEQVRKHPTSSPAAALVRGTYRAAAEPLLQHYGLRTRWLDVVDNIWVGLWFACHRQSTRGRYAYHQRRSVAQEPLGLAYIAVLRSGPLGATGVPGYRIGAESRLIDLRYAVPSVYLRPHAQHGLLLAASRLADASDVSLSKQVLAYIEVHLSDALEWLGHGVMTSSHVLFPPAVRDEGYRRLLEADLATDMLGTVTIYGSGS